MEITVDGLIQKAKKYLSADSILQVKKAFDFSFRVHSGQKRLSGEPFIVHPLAVAETLVSLEQDVPAICAGLLHDVLEDTAVTQQILEKEFGPEVYHLVEGVTKLGQLVFESREERQAENFRKMFLAMGQDLRVVLIKLADRLHNMQTLKYLPKHKIKETAKETREIFAPLAHRLGIWKIKWELEDWTFRYLETEKYDEVRNKIAESRADREEFVSGFIDEVKQHLKAVAISADIYGRPKHFYSIYRKMVEQNIEFEELYDLLAIRCIVSTVKECYAALGVIHAAWKPIPGRFHDYVAMPKSNGYQSLHTTVIGVHGRPVEIQIRTQEMHRTAEYGIAAHWKYKEGKTDVFFDNKMGWLRKLLDSQNDEQSAREFMESIKVDLFVGEVFVFTPKGEVFDFPEGSTPIDFAYRVHTQIGHRCLGCKVNGRIVPLDYKLKNGDIVEITCGKIDNPSLDWINILATSSAKNKIKSWFKKRKKEENVKRGLEKISEELKKLFLDPQKLIPDALAQKVAEGLSFNKTDELWAAIGYGEISAYQVARKMREHYKKDYPAPPIEEEIQRPKIALRRKGKKLQGIKVAQLKDVWVNFSKCCKPLPGDKIVGFITQGRGISVHRTDCKNLVLQSQKANRLVEVSWEAGSEILYPVNIEIEAFDRVGIIKDILEKIAGLKTNVAGANVKTKRGSSAIIKLTIDIHDINHLAQVFQVIRSIADVYDVYRSDIKK